MSREEFNDLTIGCSVRLIKNTNVVLTVAEIVSDERSLNNWRTRGYMDIDRIIKLEGNNGYHTWVAEYERWQHV